MDSPGGSTPRATPVRLTTSTSNRGKHQKRPSHSSSLLEDVLAEKKMALMRSPEVIQYLQAIQGQILSEKMPSGLSGTNTGHQDVTGSEDTPDYSNSGPLIIMEDELNDKEKNNYDSEQLPAGYHGNLTQPTDSHDPHGDLSGYTTRSKPGLSESVTQGSGTMSRSLQTVYPSSSGNIVCMATSGQQYVMAPSGLSPAVPSLPMSSTRSLPSHTQSLPMVSMATQAVVHGDPNKANLVTQWLNANIDVTSDRTDDTTQSAGFYQ